MSFNNYILLAKLLPFIHSETIEDRCVLFMGLTQDGFTNVEEVIYNHIRVHF